MAAEVKRTYERSDILVNNAAGNFIVPSERLSPNGFKAVVDIVLCGTFNCTRYAFEALRASRGSILNIIATYAWTGEPGALHSACAKAGVLAMTRTLAAEWGQFGIRVNAIAPGFIEKSVAILKQRPEILRDRVEPARVHQARAGSRRRRRAGWRPGRAALVSSPPLPGSSRPWDSA